MKAKNTFDVSRKLHNLAEDQTWSNLYQMGFWSLNIWQFRVGLEAIAVMNGIIDVVGVRSEKMEV